MKNFIKEKLHEAFGSTAKLPKNLEINDQTHNALKSLTWQNIKLDSAGDDGHSKIEMAVSFTDPNLNFISEGINFSIQLIKEKFYHPHIFMAKQLQGLGLGVKIFKAFIMDFGHIYVTEARTLNPDALKMINKLTFDPELEVIKGKLGMMVIKKGNPDIDELKAFIG